MEERSYPYAVSRVKASESSLIDLNLWNRLNESSIDVAYQLLNDINYGSQSVEKNNIDLLTQASVNQAREFINEITPNKILTNLFLYQVDGHNIKAILKGLIQKEDVEAILLPGGTIPLDELKEAFENDNYENFPIEIRKAIDMFEPDQSPLEISANIDNSVFAQILYDLSNKKNQNELLNHYFLTKIDLTNIITILRAFNLKWDEEQVQPLLISGGSIPLSDLTVCLTYNRDQLAEGLALGEFKNKIHDLITDFLVSKSFFKIETEFYNIAYEIIHDNYMDSFGIGPIINYLLTKEHEAEMLRILFFYKRSEKEITLAELGIK